jgi:hypothetical protein
VLEKSLWVLAADAFSLVHEQSLLVDEVGLHGLHANDGCVEVHLG